MPSVSLDELMRIRGGVWEANHTQALSLAAGLESIHDRNRENMLWVRKGLRLSAGSL